MTFFSRYGSIAPASASIDAHNQVFIETKVQISILITTQIEKCATQARLRKCK
jgi:hypothetical protein